MQEIGQIKQVWRYPVKSMRGELMDQAWVDYCGMVGDRVWEFVPARSANPAKSLSTPKRAALLLFQASLPDVPSTRFAWPTQEEWKASVTTPGGETIGVDDPLLSAIVEKRFGSAVALQFSERGFHDHRPVSLFGLSTLRQMKQQLGQPIDPLRFRSNLYAEWHDRRHLEAADLMGKALKIGDSLELLVNKAMVTDKFSAFNPATAAEDPDIVHRLTQLYPKGIGAYLVVLKPGPVCPGDPIQIIE